MVDIVEIKTDDVASDKCDTLEYLSGRLCDSPFDEFAIRAFDITPAEIARYSASKYRGKHTSELLKLLLAWRESSGLGV